MATPTPSFFDAWFPGKYVGRAPPAPSADEALQRAAAFIDDVSAVLSTQLLARHLPLPARLHPCDPTRSAPTTLTRSTLTRFTLSRTQAVRGALDDHFKRPRLQRFYHNWTWARVVVLCVYQALSFFEQPQWCYATSCHSPHVYLTSGVARLPILASNAIELVCLLLMAGFTAVKLLSYGTRTMLPQFWFLARVLLLAAALLDVCWTFADPNHFRVAPLIRPVLFVAANVRIRSHVNKMLRAGVDFAVVLLSIAILLVFFACLGVMLFEHDAVLANTTHAKDGAFPSIAQGMLQLLILLTTANYPDVMIPYYAANRSYCLFFIVFLVLGLYGLMSLALAVVYVKESL